MSTQILQGDCLAVMDLVLADVYPYLKVRDADEKPPGTLMGDRTE